MCNLMFFCAREHRAKMLAWLEACLPEHRVDGDVDTYEGWVWITLALDWSAARRRGIDPEPGDRNILRKAPKFYGTVRDDGANDGVALALDVLWTGRNVYYSERTSAGEMRVRYTLSATGRPVPNQEDLRELRTFVKMVRRSGFANLL